VGGIYFSVIIPLYNKQNTINRAINSVLRQTLESFELIIINDGSTDEGAVYVERLQNQRIRLVKQENRGVSAARNKGAELAEAPYLAFLDADDEWYPNHLADLRRLIHSFPSAGAFATGYFIKEPGRRSVPARFKYVPEGSNGGLIDSYNRCIAFGHNPVWSSAVCIRRSTFESVGGFPEGVNLYEDLHLWSRIALSYRIAFTGTPSAVYRRDADNRACLEIVPTVSDLEFSQVLLDAIESGKLIGKEVSYALEFINRYALLNSFKAIVAGNSSEGRASLQAVRPRTVNSFLRKLLIYLFSFLPGPIRKCLCGLGVGAKRRMQSSE
jgi:glycosyltransferase involved in cell wall biosynthesis